MSDIPQITASHVWLHFDVADEKLRQLRQLPEGDMTVDLWQKLTENENRIVLVTDSESVHVLMIEPPE